MMSPHCSSREVNFSSRYSTQTPQADSEGSPDSILLFTLQSSTEPGEALQLAVLASAADALHHRPGAVPCAGGFSNCCTDGAPDGGGNIGGGDTGSPPLDAGKLRCQSAVPSIPLCIVQTLSYCVASHCRQQLSRMYAASCMAPLSYAASCAVNQHINSGVHRHGCPCRYSDACAAWIESARSALADNVRAVVSHDRDRQYQRLAAMRGIAAVQRVLRSSPGAFPLGCSRIRLRTARWSWEWLLRIEPGHDCW